MMSSFASLSVRSLNMDFSTNDEDDDDDGSSVDMEEWSESVNSLGYRQIWRLDPKESLSDYTIEVAQKNPETGKSTTEKYHVHKIMLAVGHHRSQYFARLFAGDRHPEIQANVIKIHLKEPAAKAFPFFLDLLYAPTVDFFLNDKFELVHFVGLRHLADFFQTESMLKIINRIIKQALTIDNICQFYSAANAFNPPEEAVLEYIEEFSAKNILQLKANSPFLQMVSADFFIRIVSSDAILTRNALANDSSSSASSSPEARQSRTKISCHLSDLVARCCEIHSIDEETFRIFTHADFLPEISFNAARKLLLMEHRIVRHEMQSVELSDLQKRCLVTIRDNVKAIDFTDTTDETLQILRTLPSATVVDLMILMHANQAAASLERALSSPSPPTAATSAMS
jgi:BTB/POZ domain